jgi:predicted Rossmann fold flavoprotein
MAEAVRIVIVGGGAAGFFAALAAAETTPKARIRILEQSRRVLAKVAISGGGRCNLTQACFEPKRLIEAYPRGGRELRGPFHKWQPRDTMAWFEERGVATKTEDDGRVFPVSDDSRTVIDALTRAAHDAGVEVQTGCRVQDLRPGAHGAFILTLNDGTELTADRVLVATGGLKSGALTAALEAMGHTLAPLAPSLFTFHIDDRRLRGLSGLVAPAARLSLPGTGFTQTGPVLITHWGLSGPATLKLSAWAARELQAADYRAPLQIAWSGLHEAAGREQFAAERQQHGSRQVATHPLFNLPRRLWQRLVEVAGIDAATVWSHLPKTLENKLLTELTAGRYRIEGKSMNKEEFVTCGGIVLKEVDFRTMESRRVPGLYFAGECLDIDGITGGYNFQSAWTTGHLAGRAIAEAGH